MNKPSYAQVLNALCSRDPVLVKKDGSVNHNEVARRTGVPQPTVTRHLNGAVDSPRGANCLKFCLYFDVSMDQLAGNQEVAGLFPDELYQYPYSANEHMPSARREVYESWRDFTLSDNIKDYAAGDDVLWEQIIQTFKHNVENLSNENLVALIEAIGRSVSPAGALKLAQILLDHAKQGLPSVEE